METYQNYYAGFRFVYEVFVINAQTSDKISLGYLDGETYKSVMPELIKYLDDHKDFYWTVDHKPINDHKDDYLERADSFIRNSLTWETK